MFDEFQTGAPVGSRRPTIDNLHDVFSNIALDEAAHVSTMADCQDSDFLARSPNYEAMVAASVLTALAASASTVQEPWRWLSREDHLQGRFWKGFKTIFAPRSPYF